MRITELFVSSIALSLLLIHPCRSEEQDASPFSDTERLFLEVPQASSAREHLRFITSMPHVAGTFEDSIMSEYVKNTMLEAGIPDVSVFELRVLLNYPSQRPSLRLLQGEENDRVVFTAALAEDLLDDTSDTFWRNHTFHGYSPSGNVTAPLVFANYGRPSDFAALRRARVSVKDAIVLVRYGKCFRGLKVRNAQRLGAKGVLIYSDPGDDGYGVGPTYPEGPWRPSCGVQRGSVQFNSACSGDPMRIDARYASRNMTLQSICGMRHYQDFIPKIPSLPISYGDAAALLQSLGGPTARHVFGKDFSGGLKDLEYRVGPSVDTVVHLVVQNRDSITTIPNVVGYIPGTLPPERDMPVLLGNHRDAWVYGAADPNSGTASLLEMARGFGALLRTGWKPRRSIYLLSWSGEEYGLLGSTGWAELQADKISRAVAYLNADTMVSGDLLSVHATPALVTLWEQVLNDLSPLISFANGPHGEVRDANTDWQLHRHRKEGMLGSGSDYAVFLDHLGIPSLDFSFDKKVTYGQYHSIYDSFAWMDEYGGVEGKPGSAFEYMAYGAQLWGLLALRLADADVLPIDQTIQADALLNYTEAIEEQRLSLDLSALKPEVHMYKRAAEKLKSACTGKNPSLDRATCNEKLGLVERQFLNPEGLPERPWFKHILQAPGMDLGYAAEAFPGIQQAIDDDNLDVAQEQLDVAVERIRRVVVFLAVEQEADGNPW